MRLNFPGLLKEPLPSGAVRYRVRVKGHKARRIRLHVDPDHPKFREHYEAARQGIEMEPEAPPDESHIRGSVGWLVAKHIEDMERQVAAGITSWRTLKKRRGLLSQVSASVATDETLKRRGKSPMVEDWSAYSIKVPPGRILALRDRLSDTPALADSTIEALRVMFRWAMDRGYTSSNPALGIPKIDRGKGGARPWTTGDLRKFRERHHPGTTPYLGLTLLMFTACRIGDARLLGRDNEFTRNGVRGLGWQPEKRGSAYVEIPIVEPLARALRDAPVGAATYLVGKLGKPFSSGDTMSQTFKRWCHEADVPHLSAHGVRKATGDLLAHAGCSQYQIMAIHGHTQAKTSEIYTKGVQRWRLASDAVAAMRGIEW